MTRPRAHWADFRGLRHVTVTCRCGWISQNHRSRGEARRAYEGHLWYSVHGLPVGPYGVDAHRRTRP